MSDLETAVKRQVDLQAGVKEKMLKLISQAKTIDMAEAERIVATDNPRYSLRQL